LEVVPVVTTRIGLGFDSHRFVRGRPLVLGGVKIPFEFGLDGHSDADALVHAVIDALLGATGRGNIGERFPDTDPAYAGADSCALLGEVWRELAADGWRVVNLDCVVIAESPRLEPHLAAMRGRLAELLGLTPAEVSVKPKTAEGLGPIGPSRPDRRPDPRERESGLAAMAVVLMNKG
jgi:2-C-methyl-D-erythritol 2,4-cyclodiphosphate synthase